MSVDDSTSVNMTVAVPLVRCSLIAAFRRDHRTVAEAAWGYSHGSLIEISTYR